MKEISFINYLSKERSIRFFNLFPNVQVVTMEDELLEIAMFWLFWCVAFTFRLGVAK